MSMSNKYFQKFRFSNSSTSHAKLDTKTNTNSKFRKHQLWAVDKLNFKSIQLNAVWKIHSACTARYHVCVWFGYGYSYYTKHEQMNWNLISFSFCFYFLFSWLVCYLECIASHDQRWFRTMTILLEYIFHWYKERGAFLFSVKFDCFTVSLTLLRRERERKKTEENDEKNISCSYCVFEVTHIPVFALLESYIHKYIQIHTHSLLHLRRRKQKVTFEAKKRNKFLSQLFGDFLFIRPCTTLHLYIL